MKIIKREKSTTTAGHYVTNSVLLPEVIRAKSLGKVTNELAKMLMMIAERYSRKFNFVGYSFRDDMVAAALINLCNNALKFDPSKSNNPFSFYTTAIHNSFLQYIADEKKHRHIRDSLILDAGSNPSFNFLQEEKDESSSELRESDEINVVEYIDSTFIENIMNNESEISISEILDIESENIGNDNDVDNIEIINTPRKKLTIRQQQRIPGKMIVYKGKDVVLDENGNFIIKPKPIRKPKTIVVAKKAIANKNTKMTKNTKNTKNTKTTKNTNNNIKKNVKK